MGADVKAAFDELSLESVIESLIHWRFPGDLIAALVEEALELRATAQLHGVTTECFPFHALCPTINTIYKIYKNIIYIICMNI